MGINIGKWFRRQVLGQKPVTLENTLELVLKHTGYSSGVELAIALLSSKTTALKIKKQVLDEGRAIIVLELLTSLNKLQRAIAEVSETQIDPNSVSKAIVLQHLDSILEVYLREALQSADASAQGNYEQLYAAAYSVVQDVLLRTRQEIVNL
jgi:hypothetical protein